MSNTDAQIHQDVIIAQLGTVGAGPFMEKVEEIKLVEISGNWWRLSRLPALEHDAPGYSELSLDPTVAKFLEILRGALSQVARHDFPHHLVSRMLVVVMVGHFVHDLVPLP